MFTHICPEEMVFLTCGLNCKAFLTSSTSCPRSFFSTTEKRSVSCDIFSRPHLKQEIVLINFVSTIENVSRKWVHIRKILILGCHSVRRTSFFWKGDNAPLDVGGLEGRGSRAEILLPAIKPNCLKRRKLREEQMEIFTKMFTAAAGVKKEEFSLICV